MTHRGDSDHLQTLSDYDGDRCLVLGLGHTDPADGYVVTILRQSGERETARRNGPGWFSYYGDARANWFIDYHDGVHVEVTKPDGTVEFLHPFYDVEWFTNGPDADGRLYTHKRRPCPCS